MNLVAYPTADGNAATIQVKTVRTPSPAGGTGAPANGWWFPHECKAQLLALVRLSTNSVWLFRLDEARTLAQQHNDKGNRQLYWYTDDSRIPRGARSERDLYPFRFDHRVNDIFLGAARIPPVEERESNRQREALKAPTLGSPPSASHAAAVADSGGCQHPRRVKWGQTT